MSDHCLFVLHFMDPVLTHCAGILCVVRARTLMPVNLLLDLEIRNLLKVMQEISSKSGN